MHPNTAELPNQSGCSMCAAIFSASAPTTTALDPQGQIFQEVRVLVRHIDPIETRQETDGSDWLSSLH